MLKDREPLNAATCAAAEAALEVMILVAARLRVRPGDQRTELTEDEVEDLLLFWIDGPCQNDRLMAASLLTRTEEHLVEFGAGYRGPRPSERAGRMFANIMLTTELFAKVADERDVLRLSTEAFRG